MAQTEAVSEILQAKYRGNNARVEELLKGGAAPSQVQIAPGFTPFPGGAPTLTGASSAVLVVNGPNSKVRLGF